MSKTLFVDFRGNGFWVYDVVSSVFLKFLIDTASDSESLGDLGWLELATEHWRENSVNSDIGLCLDDHWSQSQIDTVVDLCLKTNTAIGKQKFIPAIRFETEPIIDGHCISTRNHDPIPGEPVERFGQAIIALLRNSLPEPPDGHWWFFDLGEETKTIRIRSETETGR